MGEYLGVQLHGASEAASWSDLLEIFTLTFSVGIWCNPAVIPPGAYEILLYFSLNVFLCSVPVLFILPLPFSFPSKCWHWLVRTMLVPQRDALSVASPLNEWWEEQPQTMKLSDIPDYRIRSGTKACRVFDVSDKLYPVNIKENYSFQLFQSNLLFPCLF